MQPNDRFKGQPKVFWANVRTVSEKNGYTRRGVGKEANNIKVPTEEELRSTYEALGLTSGHVLDGDGLTELGRLLLDYFEYRADVLYNGVRTSLLNAEQAKQLFEATKSSLQPRCPLPMNKQKGEKRVFAYLTGLTNMLIESSIGDVPCDYDPRVLTTVTRHGAPVRTLARRVDGAFPAAVNPIAIWEIKEYYHTNTFGSRVSGGVYETLLDGMELEELADHERISVKHYLIIDAYKTWWVDGRSYLCRMIDMMHMGLVDEVIFGREVIERIPMLAAEWLETLNRHLPNTPEDLGGIRDTPIELC